MLFLLMKPGAAFTADLVTRVKTAIRAELSARHVPMFIFETPEIPVGNPVPPSAGTDGADARYQTTVNLKKVELPVKQIVSGKRIQPSGTLLNPRSLEYYYRFAEVEKLVRESKL